MVYLKGRQLNRNSSSVCFYKEIYLLMNIDNHDRDSGYLGMTVQLYVQAHLGHYHILTREEKTDGTAGIYA